uniref:Uncharacterized protein n=1 Tax=Glossina austeni TaxID=7395 RepID=A0A1A9VSQ6_GLOAU
MYIVGRGRSFSSWKILSSEFLIDLCERRQFIDEKSADSSLTREHIKIKNVRNTLKAEQDSVAVEPSAPKRAIAAQVCIENGEKIKFFPRLLAAKFAYNFTPKFSKPLAKSSSLLATIVLVFGSAIAKQLNSTSEDSNTDVLLKTTIFHQNLMI